MAVFLIVLASVTVAAKADTFLAKSNAELIQEDVKQMLLAELSGHADTVRLSKIEESLRVLYTALPKTEQGLLESATVRYALHRYFLHHYGWQVKGLDNAGEAWNSSGTTTLLKARAPAYVLSLFQEHLNGDGMGLHELSVFAATVTDLIHAESVGQLERFWAVMRLPTDRPVMSNHADSAIRAFLHGYLLGSEVEVHQADDIVEMRERLEYQYPNLEETMAWVQDLRLTYDLHQRSRRNPFVEFPATFDSSAAFVLQFSHHFGSFQNLECHRLKRKLVEMEHVGTGRVLLSKFYSKALGGDWEFMESVEYLRNQGALDESNPEHPSVVIPNYMNGRMNCLMASDFYAVCCLNDCDELLGKLEKQLGVPHAEPGRIVEVVSHMQSETVDAPRNLSAALIGRLHDVAARSHAGTVPLHGRLFAQWMHHAYPRECPFPHVAGAVTPEYPEEWAMEMGEEQVEVTQEVMEEHVSREDPATSDDMLLPWTFEEELVATHSYVVEQDILAAIPVRMCAAIVALASFAVPLVRTFKVALACPAGSKLDAHFV